MSSTLFRRRTIEAVGKLDERVNPIEDLDYLARLARIQFVPFIDTPVLTYRIHGGNLSGSVKGGRWTAHPMELKLTDQLKHRYSAQALLERG